MLKMGGASKPYYQPPLARVHHLGYAAHADSCAPGILHLLEPVRARRGLVVELGCGSGLLTRHLVDAGHRVIATDASPAMVALARRHVAGAGAGAGAGAEEIDLLVLPDDPIPAADAVVSVGHVVNYLPDEAAVDRALVNVAGALRPGGILALDVCDLEWAERRRDAPGHGRVGDDWAIVTEFSVPAPNRFVRHIAVFVRNHDGSWRRHDERHDNVLLDTALAPGLLAEHGVVAEVRSSFGTEHLPPGLRAIVGHRRR